MGEIKEDEKQMSEKPLDLWLEDECVLLSAQLAGVLNASALPLAAKKLVVQNLYQDCMSTYSRAIQEQRAVYERTLKTEVE